MRSSLPKLISNITDDSKPLDYDVELPRAPMRAGILSGVFPGLGQAYNQDDLKAYLLFIATITSGVVIGFLILIASINTEALLSFVGALENLPFFDITVSPKTFKFIEQLRFPNPFTITILLVYLVYMGVSVFDAIKTAQRLEKDEVSDIPSYKKENFYEAGAISFSIHMFLLLIILVTGFLFVQPKKPQVQISQIEYIPTQRVSKKAPPKDTKRKAAKQSIDSGKHDPKRKIAPVVTPPGRPGRGATQAKAAPKPVPKKAPAPAPQAVPKEPTKPVFKPISKAVPTPKPTQASRPPEPNTKPQRYIPAPSIYKSSPGSESKSAPAPKADIGSSQSDSDSRNSSLVARLASIPRSPSSGNPGQGGAYGAVGNPGPNNFPDQAPSVAARADANYGPYMSSLQRKIKLAWNPPKGTESNRIVVVFTVARNGNLVDVQLRVASGVQSADNAAISAVRRAAPFKPLPPGAAPEIDIEFTFDYNVFQKSRF